LNKPPIHLFKPAWWLPGAHLQTIWPTILKRKFPKLKLEHKRLELADGDFIDLNRLGKNNRPIVLVLHGLMGSIHSSYALGILNCIEKNGFQGVFMHFRGCSTEPNRLPRSYHSGETGDVTEIVQYLKKQNPLQPIFAVGYSLGANVLLKWLGESGAQNPLTAAVAVSVPFELNKTVERISHGFSKIYQKNFVKELIQFHQAKFKKVMSPIDFGKVESYRTLWEFDNYVTAPLHGFKDAEEYYRKSSSRQYLKNIQKPTLIIHAKDDPFTDLDSLPSEMEVSSMVSLNYTEKGGHVGFIAGKYPWKPEYWLDDVIIDFFLKYSKTSIK
jgi:predicted alpha/beta-fold hydrolase